MSFASGVGGFLVGAGVIFVILVAFGYIDLSGAPVAAAAIASPLEAKKREYAIAGTYIGTRGIETMLIRATSTPGSYKVSFTTRPSISNGIYGSSISSVITSGTVFEHQVGTLYYANSTGNYTIQINPSDGTATISANVGGMPALYEILRKSANVDYDGKSRTIL